MTNLQRDIELYSQAWTTKMVQIWDEKLTLLGVYDTGSLIASLTGSTQPDLLTFHFLEYGVYVDSGVGYNYRGHGGDIEFLNEGYRIEHGLDVPKRVGPAWGGRMSSGKPRQRKPWFNKKFYSSTMRLKADLARIVGDTFVGIVQTLDTSASVRKSRATRPYGIGI